MYRLMWGDEWGYEDNDRDWEEEEAYDDDEDYYDCESYREREFKFTDSIETIAKSIDVLKENTVEQPPTDCGEQNGKKHHDGLFCAEDKMLPSDISIVLEGIGKINFPLELSTIEQMLAISEKARFGSLTETLLDTEVRDTQSIPASKIKAEINDQALSETLRRLKTNLNLEENVNLKLHLHNLLVYGPGQFFARHRDSEKTKNMVATLVIILPSKHDGGNLRIDHMRKSKTICSSGEEESVKLVMFYSDCEHEVRRVTEGYRVALTFNVVLEPLLDLPGIESFDVDKELENAVIQHFSHESKPTRLIVLLEHLYSEESLKWELMKGADRTVAKHLLAVGKKHHYKTILALSHNMVLYNETDGFTDSRNGSVKLYHSVDENNLKVDIDEKLERDGIQKMVVGLIEWTHGYPDRCEEIAKGWNGNEATEREYWYHCACVVLFAQ